MTELTDLQLRSMTPGDADAVITAFGRLSPESLRLRFFTPLPGLTPGQRAELVRVDPSTRVVVLAVDPATGAVVGGARAVRDAHDPTAAELAVTVGDCWQGRGLGSRLLRHLRRAALAEGITRFTGFVLTENAAARALLSRAGATAAFEEPGVLRFEILLQRAPDVTAVAAAAA